ncbi:hypothetical protein AAFF_G00106030 [Aldrovandia affinis]|uniref:Uncharacterized protein n=1 Tax=Aldrovandia affinis TaxID=143900 RepID=A0AAD7WXA4_9TELE|nr:hypothetical protein AAFF_G00106030 [Aldrovandia affinis]
MVKCGETSLQLAVVPRCRFSTVPTRWSAVLIVCSSPNSDTSQGNRDARAGRKEVTWREELRKSTADQRLVIGGLGWQGWQLSPPCGDLATQSHWPCGDEDPDTGGECAPGGRVIHIGESEESPLVVRGDLCSDFDLWAYRQAWGSYNEQLCDKMSLPDKTRFWTISKNQHLLTLSLTERDAQAVSVTRVGAGKGGPSVPLCRSSPCPRVSCRPQTADLTRASPPNSGLRGIVGDWRGEEPSHRQAHTPARTLGSFVAKGVNVSRSKEPGVRVAISDALKGFPAGVRPLRGSLTCVLFRGSSVRSGAA